ncbi:hypothetical protein LCGC14_2257510 [marine sediment metagenome]|uniref:Type II secretion system protein GspG C-terminal domain-containing protein n=1 Tax=marine sediment metagenome TaxID=412755 RepID=A0A0F9FVR1_9ZZZZ
MRLPRRGERGFTLIELLIVVAILGVLAAVVIPNLMQFIGSGETEAQETELANIQAAVSAMMIDNELTVLPTPVDTLETSDMGAFPDATSAVATALKLNDPNGIPYAVGDKDGYILYQHDITGGGGALPVDLVNYVSQPDTAYWYTVNAQGTVQQYLAAPP